MTRKEAATALGVSERTINNYAKNGRLRVAYVPGKTSPIANFDPAQIAALQEELQPTVKVEVSNIEAETSNLEPQAANFQVRSSNLEDKHALALPTSNFKVPSANFALPNVVAIEAAHLPELAQALVSALETSRAAAPSELAAKIGITVAEARVLTGLSERTLRTAIKNGELPARRIGRSLRLRPDDVRAWFDGQFKGNSTEGDHT